MNLSTQINEEIKAAMKARDNERLTTLRGLKSAIANATIDKKGELTDLEMIGVVRRELKKVQDTLDALNKADRPELLNKAVQEQSVLKTFLPKELSATELENIVQGVITELSATSKKDMGKVMKLVNERVAGRAEGKTISTLIQTILR